MALPFYQTSLLDPCSKTWKTTLSYIITFPFIRHHYQIHAQSHETQHDNLICLINENSLCNWVGLLNKLRKVKFVIKMEIFVVFDCTYHLLSVAFWFCILLVCSTVTLYFAVEKHSEDRYFAVHNYFAKFCILEECTWYQSCAPYPLV